MTLALGAIHHPRAQGFLDVASNVCVESIAWDGFVRGCYIVLLRGLSAAYEESLDETALRNMDKYVGQLASSAELLRIWQAAKA